jgi:hypothetical protein
MLIATLPAPRQDSAAIRKALCDDGFAVVAGLLPPSDLMEVEGILDDLQARLQSPAQRLQMRRFAGDMRPEAASGNIIDHKEARQDQPEVRYATVFAPRLLQSGVFRRCHELARALSGEVSHCFDHLIVKAPHNASVTPWHQDAAFSRLGAKRQALRPSRLHFWIPLQDTTEYNGCMVFLPGSHLEPLVRHEPFLRASGSMGMAASPPDLSKRQVCPVPLGGLTIHTPYTLHYAGRNMSPNPRKAWVIQFSRFGAIKLALKRVTGQLPSMDAMK